MNLLSISLLLMTIDLKQKIEMKSSIFYKEFGLITVDKIYLSIVLRNLIETWKSLLLPEKDLRYMASRHPTEDYRALNEDLFEIQDKEE